ncbi:MAG: glycosyltransferase family 39 protein [Candidatus Sungbacteria bacterium]|nr:glycosyltransferase family 39 protein [Candidatus Sungbacteria bacterium]
MTFSRSWYLPASLLLVMFVLMLGSSMGDSAIMDELAHIPAGYSYVRFFDYRLNPEHPPLVKILAAAPLLFLHLNYPQNDVSWTTEVNGQWVQGAKFLYESGNDPDKILFWARLPMILLTVFTGALIYWWVKTRFGRKVGLMTLTLFTFSPTFLAHGHYVTTDIGATLGFFIGLATFVQFLESPTKKNILIAGAAFGVAELLKFSTFLLMPIYAALIIFWAASRMELSYGARIKEGLKLIGKTVIIGAIGVLIISAAYAVFMVNYPIERQLSDSQFLLSSFGARWLVNIQETLVNNLWTRPLAHYFLGILMVIQRSAGGNTAYFLGEVSNLGSRLYFPVMYLTKETLGFHALTLMALIFGITRLLKNRPWGFRRFGYWIQNNFAVLTAGFFILFYWTYSMKSPLNIGVRHVLPTFPFIYLLVSREITTWLRGERNSAPNSWRAVLVNLYQRFVLPIPRYLTVLLIFLAIVIDVLLVYPHFLSYYNQLGGSTLFGYRVAVDSNYDWGQDLKRLGVYLDKNNISKINLNYFGGGSPKYYLGDKFEPWWSARGRPPAGEYFAVSASFLQGALNPIIPGLGRKPEDSYQWLAPYQPLDRAGYSIFIYKLP